MYCKTNKFLALPFYGTHSKPHGERGLSKNYHLRFDPKIGNGVYTILCIPCACVACTSMLYKPCISGILSDKQECYKPVIDCNYLKLLGPFNNWNITQLSQKSTPSDAFDEIHQVVLDGISENMASLVESVNYGSINKTDTATNGFYVIIFISEAYTLQNNTTIDGKIITAVELVVKAQYLCSTKVDTTWYWNQHPQQHVITVPMRTTIHPRLEVNSVPYFHSIPKNVCNRIQAKKSILRQPICLPDSVYDYIL